LAKIRAASVGAEEDQERKLFKELYSSMETLEETTMKLATIALAGALAMSSTLALAQMGGGNGEGATVPHRDQCARGRRELGLHGRTRNRRYRRGNRRWG
jgi:hypothetical protein